MPEHKSVSASPMAIVQLMVLLLLLLISSRAYADSSLLEIETQDGKYIFNVELALNNNERAVGLMNRQHMDADSGMLFRFDYVRPVAMWMKNTLIPLDMFFIRADGTVANIHHNAEPHSESVIRSSEAVLYVLELNGGVAARLNIKPGDKITHPIIDTE